MWSQVRSASKHPPLHGKTSCSSNPPARGPRSPAPPPRKASRSNPCPHADSARLRHKIATVEPMRDLIPVFLLSRIPGSLPLHARASCRGSVALNGRASRTRRSVTGDGSPGRPYGAAQDLRRERAVREQWNSVETSRNEVRPTREVATLSPDRSTTDGSARCKVCRSLPSSPAWMRWTSRAENRPWRW